MDLAYWGFSHWPFQRQQAIDRFYRGESHDEALARLLFVIDERRRCGVLIGPAGTGKTRLLRRAASYARRLGQWCIEVNATGSQGDELAWQVGEEMQIDRSVNASATHLWSQIRQELINHAMVGQDVAVVIDDINFADTGSTQVLRRLISLGESADANLTLIVSSRNPIRSSDLWNDVELVGELSGWSLEETSRFVKESLAIAGAQAEIFTADALLLVQDLSQGIPSEVVRICELAMLAALNDDRHDVDSDLITSAITELAPRYSSLAERIRLAVKQAG